MKKIAPLLLILLIGAIAVIVLFKTNLSSSDQSINPDQVQILTSILPVESLVKKLGGEHVSVNAMVPSGASVHTYEPTPSQLKNAANADLFIKVGTPIEFEVVWLDKLLAVNEQLSIVDLSQGIEFIEFEESGDHEDEHADEHEEEGDHDEDEHGHDHEGGIDPHIWLSPLNMKTMAMTIADTLSQIDPEHAMFYQEQKQLVMNELDQIDETIKEKLTGANNRDLIVYHDAWGYFARDYDLNLFAIEENEKEPTAKRLEKVINLANEYQIKVIFASPEFNTQSADTIAREVGAEVVLISPLPEDIFESFQSIASSFAQAL